MVPTKWVKFIVALFLLPICAILSQTFFTSFARATVSERLWAGVEFWFFFVRRGPLADRFFLVCRARSSFTSSATN
jgi:hypothetical protein